MEIHEGLNVANEGQLSVLLMTGFAFLRCNFDEADLADLKVEEMQLEDCSLKNANLSNFICPNLRITGSQAQGACFEGADLPEAQFVTGLIGFNLGVELGQLTIIALCFLGVGFWYRHRQWYRRAIAMPASAAIALVAMFWFVERIA